MGNMPLELPVRPRGLLSDYVDLRHTAAGIGERRAACTGGKGQMVMDDTCGTLFANLHRTSTTSAYEVVHAWYEAGTYVAGYGFPGSCRSTISSDDIDGGALG